MGDDALAGSVRRARQAVAVLASPTLRAAVLGRSRPVSERELNAAVAMFCADVAIVRRDAVDLGVLERTDDGAAYRFTR